MRESAIPLKTPKKELNMAELNGTQDLREILQTIYVFVDDFLKQVVREMDVVLEKPKISNRRPPQKQGNLSLAEIVSLGIFRFYVGSTNWKDFYRHIQTYHRQDFKKLPSYENFVSGINRTGPLAYLMCRALAYTFRENMVENEPKFADSSMLKVCGIKREFSHKVCEGLAAKGKSTMGWFFGFKLHIVCNRLMQILAVKVTPGNLDDRKGLSRTWAHIFGLIVADAGYVGKDFAHFAQSLGKRLFTGVKANMKKLMSLYQHHLLKLRQCVETVFSVLKSRFNMEITLPRSPKGYFSHYSWCLAAYQLKQFFKPVLNVNIPIFA